MILQETAMSFRKDFQKVHMELRSFFEFKRPTGTEHRDFAQVSVPVYENEFWTSKQRAGHSLHEVSYRACYKPQLPDFFLRRFAKQGSRVYDPFMGRGTTLIQARLRGCEVIGNDANPLATVLAGPRLNPPHPDEVAARLAEVRLNHMEEEKDELLVFFHPKTLAEILSWRSYFQRRRRAAMFDPVDAWVEMVICNRLTGHSSGFFSVYTLPPNQAVSVESQRRINAKRKQTPEYRDTKQLILKKTRQLLSDPLPAEYPGTASHLLVGQADSTPDIRDSSVDLIVTSPPFLDTVDYLQDNWLRMWFCQIETARPTLWQFRRLGDWLEKMTSCFNEFRRVLVNDGLIAFEVGEIRKGVLRLENQVIQAAVEAGLRPECVLINSQQFTKTANCWGVENNRDGTNSNRIVLLRKRD